MLVACCDRPMAALRLAFRPGLGLSTPFRASTDSPPNFPPTIHHTQEVAMPHSYGYRARTRSMFSRKFGEHGVNHLSTYLRNYKVRVGPYGV